MLTFNHGQVHRYIQNGMRKSYIYGPNYRVSNFSVLYRLTNSHKNKC